jgi:hypothetical protein
VHCDEHEIATDIDIGGEPGFDIEVYRQRSACYDLYGALPPNGRTISGWAHAIIERHLNGVKNMAGYEHVPRIRSTQCIYAYDDRCKVGDWPAVGASSVDKRGAPYVVFIVDCKAKFDVEQRGWEHGYSVWYQAKSGNFGGGGHCDTLALALERYNDHRGKRADEPHQPTLF